jgi:hypothetical protein
MKMDLLSNCSRCHGVGSEVVVIGGVPQVTPCLQCSETGVQKFGSTGSEIDTILSNQDWCIEALKKIMENLKIE